MRAPAAEVLTEPRTRGAGSTPKIAAVACVLVAWLVVRVWSRRAKTA
jgi:hypothetical protein